MIQQDYLIANSKKVKEVFNLKQIKSPDLIITSPPYFDLLNYDDNKSQIGFGQKNYDEFLDDLCNVFQDCYDIASPTATFWLIADTLKKNKEVKALPFDIVNKLRSKNNKTWLLRDIIIWDKGKNLPWNNNGNFKNQHEYILFFTKSEKFKFKVDRVREIIDLKKWWITYPERYNPDGKAPSNVWNFTAPIRGWGNSRQNHLCPFPFQLVERIVSISTDENDLVFDPFAGSGSVLAISKEMNRNSVGFDVNKAYKRLFHTEVSIGAKKYWVNRSKEIENNSLLIKDFKLTNKKLRKLKVASLICEHINSINKHPFIVFAKDKPKEKIELIILQNGKMPKVDLKDDKLQDLIKQTKILPEVIVKKDSEFLKENFVKKMYKYKLDKFYSYTSPSDLKKLLQNDDRYQYMYSDIAIKII